MPSIYAIGRGTDAEIRIGRQHGTVGNMHAELTLLENRTACLTRTACLIDRATRNDTSVHARDGWRAIQGTLEISLDDGFMLGEYQTQDTKCCPA